MTDSPPSPARPDAVDLMLLGGLVVTLAATTLCLGGYLAETMVWVSRAVFALAVLALVRVAFGPGDRPVRVHRAVWLPVPFLLYALASVLWLAPSGWLAWREWLLWLQAWLVFVLVLHTGRGRAGAWAWAGALVALALVGSAMAAYQRFVDPEWIMLGRKQAQYFLDRSAGSFGIPNSLAAQLELVTPACLVLLFSRSVSPAVKVLCGWLAVVFVFALVLTGSRGGWLGLAGALVAWPLLTGRDWRRKVGGAAVAVVAFVALLAGLHRYSEAARDRMDRLIDGKMETSRPLIWRTGWEIWRTAPWLGTGAASYNVHFNRHRARGFQDEPEWTHNDYLNTLGDYGVVGAVLWVGAGGAGLVFGWLAVVRARRDGNGRREIVTHWRWKLGLWLGLVAFSFHLFVDFHTKIPALAFMAAVAAALVLRDDWGSFQSVPRRTGVRGLALAAAAGLVALLVARADGLYRSEALRFEPRRSINRHASRGEGDLDAIVRTAMAAFRQAVEVDPRNGQAWADLSYATALSWHAHRQSRSLMGLLAEQSARRALDLCPEIAEFWVRHGVALDMQGRPTEARQSFDQALRLAPHNSEYWYYLAYHLSSTMGREAEAHEALAACLSLDPFNRQGLALREQLTARALRN